LVSSSQLYPRVAVPANTNTRRGQLTGQIAGLLVGPGSRLHYSLSCRVCDSTYIGSAESGTTCALAMVAGIGGQAGIGDLSTGVWPDPKTRRGGSGSNVTFPLELVQPAFVGPPSTFPGEMTRSTWAEILPRAAHRRIPPPARGQALRRPVFSAPAAVRTCFHGCAFGDSGRDRWYPVSCPSGYAGPAGDLTREWTDASDSAAP
jgi:hypothetical protein